MAIEFSAPLLPLLQLLTVQPIQALHVCTICVQKKTCKVLSQVLTLSQARDTSDKGPFYDITRSRSWNISRIEQGREKIGFPPLRAGSRQMQSSAF